MGGCGTHSCTLCKYLLCVDEADEQDTDDDGPLMKPLVAPWRKRQKKAEIKGRKRMEIYPGCTVQAAVVNGKKCCTNNVIRLPHLP